MCRGERRSPRFLYSPRRIGSVVGVCRHLIINEGPKRLVVQRIPYGKYSVPFRWLLPVAYVNRLQLDRSGWVAKWGDPMFVAQHMCPLGRLYNTEDAARFALDLWVRTVLDAVEINSASLN